MNKYLFAVLIFFISKNNILSQVNKSLATYPQIKGFVSIIHPIVTFDKDGHSFNFSGAYAVSFPIAILILKSDKIGFAFEIAPAIKVANDTAKVNNIVFDPGIIFRYKRGYNFIARIAFETSGRYGFTPVLAKTIIKRPNLNYFIATAAPVRFGNAKPPSIGLVFQLGTVF